MKNSSAFTIIEILTVVSLIAILSGLMIVEINDEIHEGTFESTVQEMEQIKKALIGNQKLYDSKGRTHFGYLGDLGGLPTAGQGLAALTVNPALPVYAYNSTIRVAIGWNGPYLDGGADAADYTTDEFGNAYSYDPTGTPPTLTSLGRDGASGGTGYDSDIVISFSDELRVATVHGRVLDNGQPYSGNAEAELNTADGNGALSQLTDAIVPADDGAFSIANVPLGLRSITVYIPNKAGATSTYGPYPITVDEPNYMIPATLIDINP